MNKKILYSLIGLAVVFFIVSLLVFLKSSRNTINKGGNVTEGVVNMAAEGPSTMQVRAFFFTESSELMQPVSYELKLSGTREEKYRQFFDLLMKERADYIVPVPLGVTIRSIYLVDAQNMMVLDFSDELLNNFPSGTSSELEFIYFFVNNICYNFRDIKKVKILIAGNEYPSITGHVDIENPYYPDYTYFNQE
jgi:hypothetical protein